MGELTQLITQHYRNVSEDHIERHREIMSDGMTHISATAATVRGIEAFLASVTLFKQAFPDLQCEIRDFIEGSDTLVAEGVHLPTQKKHCKASNRRLSRIV
jgi:predicted ester cyclase